MGKFKKVRTTKDTLTVQGNLDASNLEGFVVEIEDGEYKDLSGDFREFDGKQIRVALSVQLDEDLTEEGFNYEEEETDLGLDE